MQTVFLPDSTTQRFLRNSGISGYYLKWSKEFHRKFPNFQKEFDRTFKKFIQVFYQLRLVVIDFFYTLFEPIIKWLNSNGITMASVNHYFHERVKPKIIADYHKIQSGAEQLVFSTHKLVKEYAFHLGVWFQDNFPSGTKSFHNLQGSFAKSIQSLQTSCVQFIRWMHAAVV